MVDKVKSPKRSGLFDDAMDAVSSAYDTVKEAVTPEKGSLLDNLANRDREINKAVAKADKPKPTAKVKTTPQTRVKPQKKPSIADAAKARKWIAAQKAKGVKNPVYKPGSS